MRLPELLYRLDARDLASPLTQFEVIPTSPAGASNAFAMLTVPAGRLFLLQSFIISITPGAGETVSRREFRLRDPAAVSEFTLSAIETDVAAGVRSDMGGLSEGFGIYPGGWQLLYRQVRSPNTADTTFNEVNVTGWSIPDANWR